MICGTDGGIVVGHVGVVQQVGFQFKVLVAVVVLAVVHAAGQQFHLLLVLDQVRSFCGSVSDGRPV